MLHLPLLVGRAKKCSVHAKPMLVGARVESHAVINAADAGPALVNCALRPSMEDAGSGSLQGKCCRHAERCCKERSETLQRGCPPARFSGRRAASICVGRSSLGSIQGIFTRALAASNCTFISNLSSSEKYSFTSLQTLLSSSLM